jgi:hypothetical protein
MFDALRSTSNVSRLLTVVGIKWLCRSASSTPSASSPAEPAYASPAEPASPAAADVSFGFDVSARRGQGGHPGQTMPVEPVAQLVRARH